jgi:uncharacterized membrane protein YebE (DUF533 family)
MFNPEQLLGQILGGALGGALGGKQSRKKHKRGLGGALGSGNLAGKAQLGIGLLGIAMAAYEHYSNKPRPPASAGAPGWTPLQSRPQHMPAPPPPPPAPPVPPTPAQLDQRTRDMTVLIQAMVAAAAADGLIDPIERGHILKRANDAGLDADTRRFLESELDAPKSLDAIVAAARLELAPDVYAASVIAISLDTDAERAYLDTLAQRLQLAPEQRRTIHEQLGLA